MNRQQLYTLSGMLLASTAISGVASAATVGIGTGVTNSTTSVKIANTIFSTTATTADAVNVNQVGGKSFAVVFTNAYTTATKWSVEVDVAGAQFNTAAVGALKILVRDSTNSLATYANTIAASATCTSITPLVGKIILDSCQLSNTTFSNTSGSGANISSAAGGLVLSGVTFNTANALATAGNSIALSGVVYNSNNPSQTFESITSASVIASKAPITTTLTACPPVVLDPLATPAAFDYFTTTPTGQNTATAGKVPLTICLATVKLTLSGALSATLTGTADFGTNATSVNVTISDSLLSSAALHPTLGLQIQTTAGAFIAGATSAAFAGGVATFQIGSGSINTATNFAIDLIFSGTTPIPAAAAGSVTLAFGKGGTSSVVANATASGTAASVSRGGFNGELNTFLASTNTSFTSFARIHNMGVTAGVATVTVLNDATGAQLGSSFATTSVASAPNGGVIQPGQTLQMSNKDIETAAGFTAAAGVNYTVQITGPFIGYAQHIIFNPSTGQLADLSGFRNHDAGSGNSP